MSNATPRAPSGLRRRGRALWRELHEQFVFSEDPHRSALVEDACRTADVIDRLQAIVDDAENLRVCGSQGQPTGMPELAELRQYRALLATLLRSLALPDTEELADAKAQHAAEQAVVDAGLARAVVGTPSQAAEQVRALADRFGGDEVMVHPVASAHRGTHPATSPGREATLELLAKELF